MAKTIGKTALFLIWTASMWWLVTTKILPSSGPTSLPDVAYLGTQDETSTETRWDVFANERRMGRAEMSAKRLESGGTEVNSTMRVDRIPIQKLFRQLFGSWASLMQSMQSIPDDFEISFDSATKLVLDPEGQLENFKLSLSMEDLPELFSVEGRREGDALHVRVSSRQDLGAEPAELLKTSFPLPKQGLAADAFTPHPRLANLRLGQKWRFESYQAFPPGRSVRVTEAKVEAEELILWQGDVETVFRVTYHDVGKQGPTATTSALPYGQIWVRGDGTVLKQSMTISGMVIEFHRLPEKSSRNLPTSVSTSNRCIPRVSYDRHAT